MTPHLEHAPSAPRSSSKILSHPVGPGNGEVVDAGGGDAAGGDAACAVRMDDAVLSRGTPRTTYFRIEARLGGNNPGWGTRHERRGLGFSGLERQAAVD